jgi:ABC-type glycerol-3-phosphate transport system substrate-binding protein
VAAAACALMLALALVAIFGAKAGAVSDSTTCTTWGSANSDQQNAYARLYIEEHGAVRGVGTSPANVINAINIECLQAYNDDVSDSTTVVGAISGYF